MLIVPILFAFSGCNSGISDKDIKYLQSHEVRSLIVRAEATQNQEFVALIDPRASAKFNAAHLPGARNLKLPNLARGVRSDFDLARYTWIIVYGDNPGDPQARGMAKRLLSNQYAGVRLFAGGVEEWREMGWSLESSPTPEADSTESATTSP